MEKLSYQEHADRPAIVSAASVAEVPRRQDEWRHGLPALTGSLVTLRELRATDARALYVAMTNDLVTRYISPPPTSVDGFEKFIAWSHRQREAALGACFGIVPRGSDRVIGLFQIRALEPGFGNSEWGFAVASEFWGTGVFGDGARLAISFAFATLKAHRLEARASMENNRGGEALRKLGATREGILRKSFLRHGELHDQALWTLFADEWLGTVSAVDATGIH